MEAILLALVAAVAFANGANDVSKGIATLVGAGVLRVRRALLWGTTWTLAGAALSAVLGGALVATFARGALAEGLHVPAGFPLAVASGALAWLILATRAGMPVSTTHALTGALVGAGLLAYGPALQAGTLLTRFALPLLLSPLLSAGLALAFLPILARLDSRLGGYCLCIDQREAAPETAAAVVGDGGVAAAALRGGFPGGALDTLRGAPLDPLPEIRAGMVTECAPTLLRRGQIRGNEALHCAASGLTALARGLNDAPKIAALAMMAGAASVSPGAATAIVTLAMGAGSYWAGRRVTRTLAERITPIAPAEGLSANLITSTLTSLATFLGLPVSTTHVATGSIVGAGLSRGARRVDWGIIRQIALAWVVTLPASALLAAISWWALDR